MKKNRELDEDREGTSEKKHSQHAQQALVRMTAAAATLRRSI